MNTNTCVAQVKDRFNATKDVTATFNNKLMASGTIKDAQGNSLDLITIKVFSLPDNNLMETILTDKGNFTNYSPSGSYRFQPEDKNYGFEPPYIDVVVTDEDIYGVDFLGNPTDTTPPTTPVVTDEGEFIGYTYKLSASWISTDPETGIAEYQYAIGTSQGGTDIVGWTSSGANIGIEQTGLDLQDGKIYYFSVKARNNVFLWSEPGYSDGITVKITDTTPPTTPIVTDSGAYTSKTYKLSASWISTDPETGIAEYQYAIGTSQGGTDTVDWTSAGTNTEITRTGLSLKQNQTYYFSVNDLTPFIVPLFI